MRHSLAILATSLALFVSIAALVPQSASAQSGREEMQPPIPVHPIKRLWRDVDQLNFEIDQIHIYSRYCKPPKGPNKADTQWEIDFAFEKYKLMQQQFDRMHSAYQQAVTSRLTASFRSGFPTLDGLTADDQRYWARTSGMLRGLANRIGDLQKRLDAKKEEDCTKDNRQPPPPPPPPPVDWLKGLERPVAAPTSPVDLPPHFCSELEKGRWILDNVHPPRMQAAENARFASYYVVDVGKRMRELEVKKIFGPLTTDEERGLKLLKEEYKWAQDNLAEQDRKAAEMDANLAAAQKIPVIDCSQRPQTGVMGGDPVMQPNYELFVYPAVPPRFCSQEEKDGVISQLTVALQIATRNYDMANAKVSEIADRIAKGDNSKSTSDAFHTASDAASSYFKTKEHLRAEIAKAEAMPVVDCEAEDRRALNWGRTTPPEGVESAPAPVLELDTPQIRPPSSLGLTDDHRPAVAVGGGYVETDTPEQFIGRVVVGGTDFAMIYTPRNLDGFYGDVEGEVPLDNKPLWGVNSSFKFNFRYTDVDGGAFRDIAADPAVTTGFVFIDPQDPTRPVAGTGVGGANLAWEAHADSSSIDAAAMALYMEYRNFTPELTGSLGAGLMADYRNTEHNTLIENLDFPGFRVHENYDFSTFAIGPVFQAGLDWECDDDEPPPRFRFTVAAFIAPLYESRDLEVRQRAMAPPAVAGGFDHRQRVEFDDDGFNLHYGVNATVGWQFNERMEVFLKAGWQAETNAPTITPADGTTGAPIRPDTEDASEWFAVVGLRTQFDF